MKRQKLTTSIKVGTIALGTGVGVFALSRFTADIFSFGFAAIVLFATILAPRMTLTLPRSRFAISFSDSAIFLTFLLYGGPPAIVIAGLETAASCFYLKRNLGFSFGRLMIPTNASINVISIAATYLIWLNVPLKDLFAFGTAGTDYLLTTLGMIAILHFGISSFLAAIFQSLKEHANLFSIWKRDCFSSSMTQIVGAGLSLLIFKIIHYGELTAGLMVFAAVGIAYFSYRQTIDDINNAIAQAEEAERLKAETERARRLEAEEHSDQLAASLENQERANRALRKSEQGFQHAALHDSLTRLTNRKYLGDKLQQLIRDYKLDPKANFYVLFLDIHRFKNINDSLGHTVGDKVLMIAAKRFVRMLNPSDTVARLGGDEFAVILRGLSSVGKAQKVARRIHDSISQPFSLSRNKITIGLNIGIAPCDAEYSTPEEILRDADIAMHYAKEKNLGVAIFTKELRSRFLERARLEMDLNQAVERNELAMHYQPIVDLSDGRLLGFEALLRWHHSEFGMIPPNKFIPIAEDTGLIIPITDWILQTTTAQLAQWQKLKKEYNDLIVSVNISGRHLSHEDLADDIERVLTESKLKPSSLKLEITESTAMESPEATVKILNKLKKLGVRLSIDDFGTGYSSLSILHRLPFDTLKIDRSFVTAVGENGEDSEILQTIMSLAKNLRMQVIAEGIETDEQLALLQSLGCDYGQGYLLSRPQSKDKIERFLTEGRNWFPAKFTPLVNPHTSEPAVSDSDLPVF